MRADEIRELGAEDIAARVKDLEEERFRLKFRSATEPLEEPLRLRSIRKDIARLKTIASEREKGIVRDPRVNVEIAQYRPYYILGEVKKSGEYPYRLGLTVMDAVASAGGFMARGCG